MSHLSSLFILVAEEPVAAAGLRPGRGPVNAERVLAVTLVIGGARSGKSAYAQREAERAADAAGVRPVMIATAQVLDDEMRERVDRHRADRGGGWRTLEAPLELEAAVEALGPGEPAVVDCLTLWLSNLMLAGEDAEARGRALAEAARRSPARLWIVTNEVGQGIVPDNALARRFRDEAGRLNQRMAAAADEVVLVTAGLPLRLKPASG